MREHVGRKCYSGAFRELRRIERMKDLVELAQRIALNVEDTKIKRDIKL